MRAGVGSLGVEDISSDASAVDGLLRGWGMGRETPMFVEPSSVKEHNIDVVIRSRRHASYVS